MSKQVDNRIVQLELDNSDFEKHAEQTLGTIDELDEALQFNDGDEGLKRIEKHSSKFNLGGMTVAIEGVVHQFSALEIAGITAIQNITNRAVDYGVKMAKSLSVDQLASGWNKYEQKTASVQTLVNSTGKSVDEIDGYLERLMQYSDETSYSFVEMTGALAQMTSSGGDIDKLMPMIMGIANATAFAGKGSREFQSTIRNLAQSYQAGHLQLMDMKSLNLMGTSSKQLKETFISVAESMGKIEKGSVTIENFDETLKSKWADTEVMEAALGKFSEFSEVVLDAVNRGEYDTAAEAIEALSGNYDELAVRAFASAQEAKSFSEAIEATKDAVSSGWLETFEIIFGNYEESKKMWTDLANELWEIFASGAEARNEALKEWKAGGGRDALLESIKNFYQGIKAIVAPVKEAFNNIFGSINSEFLIDLTNKIKTISEKFKRAFGVVEDAVEDGKEAIDGIKDSVEKALGPVAKTKEVLDELANSVILGKYGNGETRRKQLEELGYSYELVQNRVNELLGCSYRYEVIEDEIIETDEKREESLENLKESTEEITEETEEYRKELKKQEKAADRMKKVEKIFEGVFSAIKIVINILKEAGEAASKIFAVAWEKALLPVIDWFIDLSAKVADYVTELSNSLDFATKIHDFFTKFADTVSTWITNITDFIKNLWKNIADRGSFQHLFESLKSLLGMLGDIATAIFDGLVGGFEALGDEGKIKMPTVDDLGGWVDMVVTAIANFIDNVVSHKDEISGFFGIFTQDVVTKVGEVAGSLTDLFSTSMTFFNNPFDKLTKFFTDGEKQLMAVDGPVGALTGGIEKLTGETEGFANALNMDELFESAKKVGILAVIFEAIKGFANVASALGNVSKVPKTVVELLQDLRETMISYQNNLNAKNLKTVAEAIGIMVLAIIGLSLIEDQTKIDKAVAAIMMVAISLALVFKTFTELKKLSAVQIGSKEILKPIVSFLEGIRDAVSKGIKIAAFGLLMVGVAVAVGMIIKIIGDLKEVSWSEEGEKLKQAAAVVAMIILFMTAVASFYGWATSNRKVKTSAGDALIFVGMAVGLVIMVQALKILMNELDILGPNAIGTLMASVAAIAILMLAMGAAAGVATQGEAKKGKGLVAFGMSMLMMAGAIAAIMWSITILNDVPLGQIIVAGVIIAGIIGMYALLMHTMGEMDAQKAAMAITAITTMSISFMALAGTLILIGQYADQVQKALGPMLVLFAVLGIFTAVIGATGSAEALNAISTSFLKFGIAILAVSTAAYMFGKAIPAVVDGIAYLGEAIRTKGKDIAIGIGIILAAIAIAIIAHKVLIADSLTQLVSEVLSKMSLEFLKKLPKMLLMIFIVVMVILTFLEAIAPEFTDKLVSLIVTVMHSIADALRNHAKEIFDAALDILDALIDMVYEMLASISEKIFGENNWFAKMLRGAAKDGVNGAVEELDKGAEKVEDASKSYKTSLKDMEASTQNTMNSQADWFQEGQKYIDEYTQTVVGANETMEASGDAMASTMTDTKDTILDKMKMDGEMGEAANMSIEAYTSQLVSGGEVTADSAEGIASDVNNPFVVLANTDAPEDGKNTMLGLGDGMSQHSDYPISVAHDTANAINAEFQRIQKIASPSKIWFGFGKFLMQGLANGISRYSTNAINETEELAYTINNPMTGIASKISSVLNSNLDLSPTIRPVLDASNIESGSSLINGMFNARHVGVYAGEIQTNSMRLAGEIDSALDSRLGEFNAAMQMYSETEANRTIEVPLTIDGREFARATATYQRDEINRLDRNDLRRLGTV